MGFAELLRTAALDVGAFGGSSQSEDREGGGVNLEVRDENFWSDTSSAHTFKALVRPGAWVMLQMWSLGVLRPHL